MAEASIRCQGTKKVNVKFRVVETPDILQREEKVIDNIVTSISVQYKPEEEKKLKIP
jgi:hypothetical protein